MKTKLVMPLDAIEVRDGELEMVLGGFVATPDGVNGGAGCGCGCACSDGVGCGCGCGNGAGCGCECKPITTTAAPI